MLIRLVQQLSTRARAQVVGCGDLIFNFLGEGRSAIYWGKLCRVIIYEVGGSQASCSHTKSGTVAFLSMHQVANDV